MINRYNEALEVRAFIEDLYETKLQEKMGFDLLRDVQLLSPTHKGPIGCMELNKALQQIILKKTRDFDVRAYEGIFPQHDKKKAKERPTFFTGDKVIQNRNNYELGVMNGSVGIVVGPGEKFDVVKGKTLPGLAVDFEGEEVVYTKEDRADLSLAYALTIHKSQGSEFPCVICIVHKSHSFMHAQNLFYTGVTRAQRW